MGKCDTASKFGIGFALGIHLFTRFSSGQLKKCHTTDCVDTEIQYYKNMRGKVLCLLPSLSFFTTNINYYAQIDKQQFKKSSSCYKWTEKLCRCLEQDYRNYSLRYVWIIRKAVSSEYIQERIRLRMMNDECIKFFIDIRKKVLQSLYHTKRFQKQDDVSVHCFLLIKQQEKFTNQQGGRNQQSMLDLI